MAGVFILAMTGVAFLTGSLSNAYFVQHGPLMKAIVSKMIDEKKGLAVLQMVKEEMEMMLNVFAFTKDLLGCITNMDLTNPNL